MIHGPKRGETELLDPDAAQAREDSQSIHVRVLALRGTHAERAETLQQLARVEAFLGRVLEVLHLQILVEVDEILARRMGENREWMRGAARAALDGRSRARTVPRIGGGLRASAPAVSKPRSEFIHPVHA